MIDCKSLLLVSEKASKTGLGLVELISVSLLLKEGLGRIAISRRLNYRERLVREVIKSLKSEDLKEQVFKLLANFASMKIDAPWLKCVPIFYGHFDHSVLECVESRVVALRDYLIILSGNPSKVEAIGLVLNRAVKYPGLPTELLEPYYSAAMLVREKNGIVLCWREYKGHIDDSILLASLANLCSAI